MFGDGVSGVLLNVAKVSAALFGGTFAVYSVTSTICERRLLDRKKKDGKLCGACKGKGFWPCKLCKGNTTIKWSPLYDPVFINPCLCPTCDGFKVQRCLNCLGCGYVL